MDRQPASPLLARALPVAVDADVTFAEPWEAKAFAIIVKLAQAGHFTWSEWVECFSKEVAAATAVEAAGGTPRTYYEQWLNAAETLLVDKGVTSREQLLARRIAIGAVGTMHVMPS
jgi:nitrile hydratase accessory protein